MAVRICDHLPLEVARREYQRQLYNLHLVYGAEAIVHDDFEELHKLITHIDAVWLLDFEFTSREEALIEALESRFRAHREDVEEASAHIQQLETEIAELRAQLQGAAP